MKKPFDSDLLIVTDAPEARKQHDSYLLISLLTIPNKHRQENPTPSYRPGGSEMIYSLPMAVRLMADLRPSTDWSAGCTVQISCGRPAAGSQRAYSLGWNKQTDGSRYRLMPPYGGGIIIQTGTQRN